MMSPLINMIGTCHYKSVSPTYARALSITTQTVHSIDRSELSRQYTEPRIAKRDSMYDDRHIVYF